MSIRLLTDLPNRIKSPEPWKDVRPSLPWHDPGFSRRMLKEHLDSTHDLGSRRPAIIASQIRWMHETWFGPREVETILDLSCGPGLVANALARMGYTVRGIDIAPASIDYARKVASDEGLRATFVQGDIREIGYGGGYDAALFTYGMPNSFRWEEFSIILLRMKEALNPGGLAILEMLTPDSMRRKAGTDWYTCPNGGLFSESPCIVLTEYFYRAEENTACRLNYVIDPVTTRVRDYATCYQAYNENDLELLLKACGLRLIDEFDSLTGEKGIREPEMKVYVVERILTE